MLSEEAFLAVLTVDVWFIAYPHVASMYTRIAFDRASVKRYWFFLTALYPLVLVATALGTYWGGLVFLNSLYFYWQTFHYSRQSYGISRAYLRSSTSSGPIAPDHLTTFVVAAFPIWGLLHRASQQQGFFYSSALYSPPVPVSVATFAGAVALTSLGVWLYQRVQRGDFRSEAVETIDNKESCPNKSARRPVFSGVWSARLFRERLGQSLFVLSHVAMTTVSYVGIRDITAGWLFINIWHNAQYILFVWAFNARTFRAGVDPERRLLSWLSQPSRVGIYAVVCMGLAGAIYGTLWVVTAQITSTVLPVVMVAYLAFNFHHYIVDAVIWRSPRAQPRLDRA